jgi:hypothetical protein
VSIGNVKKHLNCEVIGKFILVENLGGFFGFLNFSCGGCWDCVDFARVGGFSNSMNFR